MNRSQLAPVLLALLSISALGVAATTLETTLTTDPDEEINPDWDRLPIGQGDAGSILEQMDDRNGDSEADSEADELVEQPADSDQVDGSGTGSGTSAAESTLLERLLALLMAILGALLPVVVVVALGVLAYHYREGLLSILAPGSTAEPAPEAQPWPGSTPSNAVDRAWVALVQRLDPERPETTTTAECRVLARDRGLDVGAVEAITTAFERVHYGGVPVGEEEQRAQEGLRQLKGENGLRQLEEGNELRRSDGGNG